jgi:hypothetical protein
MTKKETIGLPSQRCKISAGLFWADYAVLGAQVQELEAAGVDWIHIEVRDGKYMDFGMPRGGFDIIEATRKSTNLEIEAQLQMVRPNFDVFKQLADLGVDNCRRLKQWEMTFRLLPSSALTLCRCVGLQESTVARQHILPY